MGQKCQFAANKYIYRPLAILVFYAVCYLFKGIFPVQTNSLRYEDYLKSIPTKSAFFLKENKIENASCDTWSIVGGFRTFCISNVAEKAKDFDCYTSQRSSYVPAHQVRLGNNFVTANDEQHKDISYHIYM